ncbi:MAG: response regulator [Anaerolineae bacterium]|nr:response regulator [Anaerolineae bacterium]
MTKILIAEDERDIRELIGHTLRFAGYDAVLVANGLDAVEAAAREKPDLILLDVRMPRMTGYEACEKIKGNPETRDIPVVFLSAKGQDSEIKRGLESGALKYILKPFVPAELIAQIENILK